MVCKGLLKKGMNLFMKASSAVNFTGRIEEELSIDGNPPLNHPSKVGQRSTDTTLFQLIKMMILMRMGSRLSER